MGLNATELMILHHLALTLQKDGRQNVRALSLGYPDMLVLPGALEGQGLRLDLSAVDRREGARSIWAAHGRDISQEMLEPVSLFRSFQTELEVIDHPGAPVKDHAIDLNEPIPDALAERYDLVIDPGTVEHCFNIGTAMANCARLVRPGGYIYHQSALAYINHGFFSLSPTFFADFYRANGFRASAAYDFFQDIDEHGFVVRLRRIDFFNNQPIDQDPMVGVYVFRKMETVRQIRYPMQSIYCGGQREGQPSFDIIREGLPTHMVTP